MKSSSGGELVVFIGHAEDAKAEAKFVYGLQADFQRELKFRLEHAEHPPFTSVDAWEWNADTNGWSGGQDILITPHLEDAHFAVFVFKGRVGKGTVAELDRCRELREDRPAIAAVFPKSFPYPERVDDDVALADWLDVKRYKQSLCQGWADAGSTAIRPLDDYTDHESLKQIVLAQFKIDLGEIIKRAKARAGFAHVPPPPASAMPKEIYDRIEQVSFDRSLLLLLSVADLDQAAVSALLSQPLIQSELLAESLTSMPPALQLEQLGLASNGRPTVGLFLCCAQRKDLIDKFSCCSLRMVVYSEINRAQAQVTFNDEPSGSLLSLFEKGLVFLERSAGLIRVGNVGSTDRDELEIPIAVLREALVNAFIHRDYESPIARAQPTRIEVYPDRVEISSFGGLPDGVSMNLINSDPEKVGSVRRNEIVAKIFVWRQHAELNASGVARIQALLSQRGLPPALIAEVEGDKVVRVTLYRPFRPRSKFESAERVRPPEAPRRRETVYISSTIRDLPDHREQVRLACERAGFAPVEVERSVASAQDDLQMMFDRIAQADVFIGLIAHRYGAILPGFDVSASELEFDHAVKLGKPVLMFLMAADHPVTVSDIEVDPVARTKLKDFRSRVASERVVGYFRSAGDLRALVVEALSEVELALHTAQLDGRAQADAAEAVTRYSAIPAPPAPYVAHPYTLLQSTGLAGRRQELAALSKWAAPSQSKTGGKPIFLLAGIGGVGKSALAWTWFSNASPRKTRAAGLLWWSFCESSFEMFVTRALAYVENIPEADAAKLPWQEREALLLKRLEEKRYLIVLDGLERILGAYSRTGGLREEADSSSSVGPRATIDPRADHFLLRLAQIRRSRILITTRLIPDALQLASRSVLPGCVAMTLGGLSNQDALSLWQGLSVSGSSDELLPLFNSVENHPLLIQMLASAVANYRRAPGDFARWRADNPSFDPTSLSSVQAAASVMAKAFAGLNGKSRKVLEAIVQFRVAVGYDALVAVLSGPGREILSPVELDVVLTDLEDRGLVAWNRARDLYEVHSIIRAYVLNTMTRGPSGTIQADIEKYFAAHPERDTRDK
ncbi:MAG: DUF4062 domain-containing protein [Rhizomicrobium sp.]